MDRLRRLLLPVFRMIHPTLMYSSLFWLMPITSTNLKRIVSSSRKGVCILSINLLVELTEHSSWSSRNRFYTIVIDNLSSILMFQFLFWFAFILQWSRLLRSSESIVPCWVESISCYQNMKFPRHLPFIPSMVLSTHFLHWPARKYSFLTFILLFCLSLPFMCCLLLYYRIRTKSSFKARLIYRWIL